MKKVIAFGTFDILHKGHLNFLKQAKALGDFLIVVIARNETAEKFKGRNPQNNEGERKRAVLRSGLADKVILGSLTDKYKAIKHFRPDIICLGYDQFAFSKNLKSELEEFSLTGTKIIRLKAYRPEKYKSSKLKRPRQ